MWKCRKCIMKQHWNNGGIQLASAKCQPEPEKGVYKSAYRPGCAARKAKSKDQQKAVCKKYDFKTFAD